MRPDQVVDVLALMGDSVDNIKGVPGIGEKGARELIAAHGTLDALLDAAPTIAAEALPRRPAGARRRRARSSRELARIRTDVPVTFDAGRAAVPRAVARALLRAVLVARLPRRSSPSSRRRRQTAPRDYTVVTSIEDVDALAAALARRRTHRRRGRSRRRLGRPRRHRRLGVLSARPARRATCRSATRASPTRRTCRRGTCSRGSARCWRTRPSARSGTT